MRTKRKEQKFFKKNMFSKRSSGQVRWVLKSCWKAFVKNLKFLSSILKWIAENSSNYTKSSSPEFCCKKNNFDSSAVNFLLKLQIVSIQEEKLNTEFSFSENVASVFLLWKRKMQLWQPCRQLLPTIRNAPAHSARPFRVINLPENFQWKFLCTRQIRTWRTSWKVFSEIRELSSKIQNFF